MTVWVVMETYKTGMPDIQVFGNERKAREAAAKIDGDVEIFEKKVR